MGCDKETATDWFCLALGGKNRTTSGNTMEAGFGF